MNKLKWYDFLGALILLFSVTKSAIEPPAATDHANLLLTPSAPTSFNKDSRKIPPREVALSQIDTLSPSMSGIFIGDLSFSDIKDDRMNALHGDASNLGSNSTAKSIPEATLRVETYPDWNGNIRVSSRPSHPHILRFLFVR